MSNDDVPSPGPAQKNGSGKKARKGKGTDNSNHAAQIEEDSSQAMLSSAKEKKGNGQSNAVSLPQGKNGFWSKVRRFWYKESLPKSEHGRLPGEGSTENPHSAVKNLLHGRSVSEILVPRMDMQAAPKGKSFSFYTKLAIDSGYSRIPIYNNDIDDIVGVLHVKELLQYVKREVKDFDVGNVSRPPYIVPESLGLDELLKNFLIKQIHMAIVVDEYGGVSGIVTLEDVIEEIVGEIQDEFDHEESFVQKKGKSKYEIDARLSIEDAQRELGLQLPDEEFDTVGGFIYHLVGRVPQKNEIVNYQGHEFKVLSLEGNRIKKVMVNFSEGGSDK